MKKTNPLSHLRCHQALTERVSYNANGAAPRGAAPFVLCVQSNLLGAVDAVACVAQTGNDIAVLVQVVVLCAEVDIHIRVCLV